MAASIRSTCTRDTYIGSICVIVTWIKRIQSKILAGLGTVVS